MKLDELERRVLGVLVEKEATTPDQYPLSLNALTSGCNQKSNRDPVLSVSEAEVLVTFEGLRLKGLAGTTHQAGGRVERFRHSARETLGVGGGTLAVLVELMLRGPQTVGELKTRASRIRELASTDDVNDALQELSTKDYARPLPQQPGSRATRWAHTLGDDTSAAPEPTPSTPAPATPAPPSPTPKAAPDLAARVATLEAEVEHQRRCLEHLSEVLGESLPERSSPAP